MSSENEKRDVELNEEELDGVSGGANAFDAIGLNQKGFTFTFTAVDNQAADVKSNAVNPTHPENQHKL